LLPRGLLPLASPEAGGRLPPAGELQSPAWGPQREAVAGRVIPHRWIAADMLEAERLFRRVNGYRDLHVLKRDRGKGGAVRRHLPAGSPFWGDGTSLHQARLALLREAEL